MKPFEALMGELIDYAGLFPPAKLDVKTTVANYASARASAERWMLGRLICPASRLDELLAAENEIDRGDEDEGPWPLSLIVGKDWEAEFDRIGEFQEKAGERFAVEAIETKIESARDVDAIADEVPEEVIAYFEIPTDREFRGPITAIAGTDHAAKIRTGGVTPDLIPSAETVADFLIACHDAGVPFKSTAGLHQPVRHHDDEVGALVHGFLCVFGAAIMRFVHGCDREEIIRMLNTDQIQVFGFVDDEWRFSDRSARAHEIEEAREWAHSFGSCSFDEPIQSLNMAQFFEPDRPAAGRS